MTNTTKAQIIAFGNSMLALVVAFGVDLSDAQTAAISVAVNSALGLWVALTYRDSKKRVADGSDGG